MDPIVSSPATGRGVTATFGNLSSPWCKAINVIGTVCVEPSYAKCEPGFQPVGLSTHCGNKITQLLTTYQPFFHHFFDVESHFVPSIWVFLSLPPMEWGSDGEKSRDWLSGIQRWELMFRGVLWKRRWYNANSCCRDNLLYEIISTIPYHSCIVITYIHVRYIDWYLDLSPWGVWRIAVTLRAQSLVKLQIRMPMAQWEGNACTSLTNSKGSFSSSSACPGTTSSPVTPNRSTQVTLVSRASISLFTIASRCSRHVGEFDTTESTVLPTSISTSAPRH